MTSRNDAEHAGPAPDRGGEMLDLGALWAAIKARKLWIVGPTLLALAGTAVAVNLVPPRYTGEARLLLENRDSFYTRPGQGSEGAPPQFDSEGIQSQVQIIMSRDLAREAIRRIGLVGNAEFDSGAGALSGLRKIGVLIGLGSHPADRSPEDRVLETYYERLLVFPVARSRIVAVEFTSRDPALAAKGANEIAATYLEMQEAAKQDTARSASSWLKNTIEPLRTRLAESEARVEQFRSRNGLLAGGGTGTITAQQLGDLSTQLSGARSQQAEAQAKAKIMREALKQGRTFDVPDIANNELVRRLIEQRVTLRAQIALESRSLLSEHPRIKELAAQLADLEGQIRAAAERAVRTLENEARIAGERVESFTAALEGQKKNVSTANDSEVQLRALEREARTQRDQLEQYMSRYREALARDVQNAAPADARIVSRAIEPTSPSFPKKLPTILLATLATFLVSLATVVSRELLTGRAAARTPAPAMPASAPGWAAAGPAMFRDEDAERRKLRVAGLLTHAGRFGQLQLDPDDAEGWHADLSALIGPPGPGRGPVLLVLDASGEPEVSALGLGVALASLSRTVLIDLAADSAAGGVGFSELLSGEASFADVIMRHGETRLHVIGSGRAGREAVLSAPEIVEVALDALTETYDWVLVATSSNDPASLIAPLAARAQGCLVAAGNIGNGHAVETANRLGELTREPVALVFAPARAGRQREYDEAMA